MNNPPTSTDLLLSLQRALLGEVHVDLRAVSIESDTAGKTVMMRFEYSSEPRGDARKCGSRIAASVFANLPDDWALEDEHLARPLPTRCQPLEHLAYRRYES